MKAYWGSGSIAPCFLVLGTSDYNSQNVRFRSFKFVYFFQKRDSCRYKIAPFKQKLPLVMASVELFGVQCYNNGCSFLIFGSIATGFSSCFVCPPLLNSWHSLPLLWVIFTIRCQMLMSLLPSFLLQKQYVCLNFTIVIMLMMIRV
jgi:hypothetical protein